MEMEVGRRDGDGGGAGRLGLAEAADSRRYN